MCRFIHCQLSSTTHIQAILFRKTTSTTTELLRSGTLHDDSVGSAYASLLNLHYTLDDDVLT